MHDITDEEQNMKWLNWNRCEDTQLKKCIQRHCSLF
jgi:hypothetical protein